MREFFHGLIPVEAWIWIVFFLIPLAGAVVWQVFLCLRAKKTWTKFWPLIAAACIPAVVYGCHFLDILQPVFGGFVGALLLGTAAFLAAGSLIGWALFGIVRLSRK
ncbi:MAG: hypothetical protein II889_00945 [Clostridia bacterium]|nr:hypothetical protein [Clostridia bacterium]